MREWFFIIILLSVVLTGCASVETNAELAQTYIDLGLGYAQQGKWQLAEEKLQHAVTLQPSSPDAQEALGYLYAVSNDPTRAKIHFEKALQLAQDKPDVLTRVQNNYGVFLCRQGLVAEARQYTKHCVVKASE